MQEREVRGNGPYKDPSGSGGWVTGHKVGRGEEDRERNIQGKNGRNNIRDQREEISNWLGPGGVLRRTVWWPSGQVGLSVLYRMLPISFERVDERLP
jgi:hypothetical protein